MTAAVVQESYLRQDSHVQALKHSVFEAEHCPGPGVLYGHVAVVWHGVLSCHCCSDWGCAGLPGLADQATLEL